MSIQFKRCLLLIWLLTTSGLLTYIATIYEAYTGQPYQNDFTENCYNYQQVKGLKFVRSKLTIDPIELPQ